MDGLVADLTSLEQTARLAEEARALTPVDVLINNAGVGFGRDAKQREVSRDGLELRWAVNYLAPFVLSERLLGATPTPRVVLNVASVGQKELNLEDLQSTRHYDGVEAYRRSKLALIMLTFDLAKAHPGVACNALHPGTFLDTAMVRDANVTPMGPASRGVDSIAHVLRASLESGVSGQYFDETRASRPLPQALDEGFRRQLQTRTREQLRAFLPGPSLG